MTLICLYLHFCFIYYSRFCFTVTDAGSNSGVLGRSGSGGLGGAAAGFGSSFFLGAIAKSSQESVGWTNTKEGSSTVQVDGGPSEAKSLYALSTGISTPLCMPSPTANNREETIKGYAFVFLFKTKVAVCVHHQDMDNVELHWLKSLASGYFHRHK